jgi:RimJ/RimL family protein N-acetyltransferase
MEARVWPLFGLVVTTPRLTLRYVDDELGAELAQLAARGIHDPATMPFAEPWTDADSPELERNTMRYYWRNRAETSSAHWDLNMTVWREQTVVGMCSVTADDFPVTRTASTGSWLGREYQGHGLGREIRRAALCLIFTGLDADRATTSAWHDNAASLGVTRSLGYVETGSRIQPRRDQPDTMLDFAMTNRQWLASHVSEDIELTGIEPVRQFLDTARA